MALDGYEVYNWPEFQALLKRLNVDQHRPSPIKEFGIYLKEGEPPTLTIVRKEPPDATV